LEGVFRTVGYWPDEGLDADHKIQSKKCLTTQPIACRKELGAL
jgi:hypothetical protein